MLAEFLDGLIHHPPVFPSFATPAYSNVAFTFLQFVYESITGRSFSQAFDELYQDRLQMHSTSSLHPVKDVDAVIPHNDTWAVFSYPIGNQWV
jgi:CubicO group peptidase (beta-lactamase class C family)